MRVTTGKPGWIRNAEGLRQHLEDDSSRETWAFDYKVRVDAKPGEIGLKLAKAIAAMANAQGGQLLLGVREEWGVPTDRVGIENPETTMEQVEGAMSQWLSQIEPRPTLDVFHLDGLAFVVITVQPCVRLVAHLGNKYERHRIMYPQRGSDRTFHMRPEEVEARILSYGPRAQRIKIEQLCARVEDDRVDLFHVYHSGGRGQGDTRTVLGWKNGAVRISEFEEFGVWLGFSGYRAPNRTEEQELEIWIPYEWVAVHIRGQRLSLVLRAYISAEPKGPVVVPLPPMS